MAGEPDYDSWNFINQSPLTNTTSYLNFDAADPWEQLQQPSTQPFPEFCTNMLGDAPGFTMEQQKTVAPGAYLNHQAMNTMPQNTHLYPSPPLNLAPSTANVHKAQAQFTARQAVNEFLREPNMPIEGQVIMGGTPQFLDTYKSLALRNHIGAGTEQFLRMLQNRMMARTISAQGKLTAKSYHPIFLFDVLQLPGSLATTLGKVDTVYLVDRTTPAILPGFQVRKHAGHHQPMLIYTGINTDVVHGAIIFGQGKNQENLLSQHYGAAGNLKMKAWAVFETINTGPTDIHQSQGHAYISRQCMKVTTFGYFGQVAVGKAEELVKWDLDECLQGRYGQSPLHFVGPSGPMQYNPRNSDGFNTFA